MGFTRKALFLGTGGLSGLFIKANSKKERTAKAAEKQLQLQRQMMRQQQTPYQQAPVATEPRRARCPHCRSVFGYASPGWLRCPSCGKRIKILPRR
jgi:hypothetical protein